MVSEAPWNIYRPIQPLLSVSRALGLAPVRSAPGSDLKVFPSTGAVIWTGLLCLLLLCSAVLYLFRALGNKEVMLDPDTDYSKAVYTIILDIVLLYGSGLCAVASSALVVSRRLNALLSCFALADRVLFADTDALYRRTRVYILIAIACPVLVLTAMFLYDALINGVHAWISDLLPTYPLIFCVVLETQMCVVILALRNRFRRVNEYFEVLLNESRPLNGVDPFWNEKKKSVFVEEEKTINGSQELNQELCNAVFYDVYLGKSKRTNGKLYTDNLCSTPDLNSLFEVHDALCHGIQLFNEIFGLQMLVELMGLFIGIISGVFYAVKYGMQWCIHSLLNDIITISVLSISGHLCTKSANSTSSLVSRLMLRPSSPDVRRLLARFASQLLHARTRIFICGLLVLDNALLARMAGAVATYTVILVQYQGSQETISFPSINTTLDTDMTLPATEMYLDEEPIS